jgi:hypothetical protein
MKTRIWAFVIYSIFFEAIVWGLFGYVVFWKGYSGWWIVLALAISAAQIKPSDFGITKKEVDKND